MKQYIELPVTDEMREDLKDCKERTQKGINTICGLCTLNGGYFGCLAEQKWISREEECATVAQIEQLKKDNTALLDKVGYFVKCDECEYRKDESNGISWCRLSSGFDLDLKKGDGCSRGKRKIDGE